MKFSKTTKKDVSEYLPYSQFFREIYRLFKTDLILHTGGKLCDSDLELLKQWELVPPAEKIPPALLNKNGEEELKNFGKRLKNTFPELLKAGSIPGVSQKDYKVSALLY